MIRWAPAAILRSRRSHSVVASAAVGSSAQAIVNDGRLPDRRAGRVLAAVEAGQDLDEPDRVDVPHPGRARKIADPRRVAGERQDVADAERVGAQQLRLERHEVPVAGRDVDDALEVEVVLDPERHGERAHPHPGHRRVADVDDVDAGVLEHAGRLDRALDADGARRVDLDRDDVAAVRRGPARAATVAAAASVAAATSARIEVVGAARAPLPAPRRHRSAPTRASIAARIAAMCSGVVPQQPPTIAAPASSMSPTIRPR